MVRLSRLTDYALVLLTRLAHSKDEAQSAHRLAADTHLHLPMASKALKALARAHWIESQRGALGGYRLHRPAQSIRILDVVELFEGRVAMTQCQSQSPCELHAHCGIRPHWTLINSRIRDELGRLTIADLCQPPAIHNNGITPLAAITA